jgi:hypothetical protein
MELYKTDKTAAESRYGPFETWGVTDIHISNWNKTGNFTTDEQLFGEVEETPDDSNIIWSMDEQLFGLTLQWPILRYNPFASLYSTEFYVRIRGVSSESFSEPVFKRRITHSIYNTTSDEISEGDIYIIATDDKADGDDGYPGAGVRVHVKVMGYFDNMKDIISAAQSAYSVCPVYDEMGCWGPCDAACGQGRQTRFVGNVIDTGIYTDNCPNGVSQTRPCNKGPCPAPLGSLQDEDCVMTDWGEWGECKATAAAIIPGAEIKCTDESRGRHYGQQIRYRGIETCHKGNTYNQRTGQLATCPSSSQVRSCDGCGMDFGDTRLTNVPRAPNICYPGAWTCD